MRLNVAVFAPPGMPVPPLGVEDFTVYDNGVLQDVELIWRPTDTPLHVALVFDASPSVRPWWLSVRRAAITFLVKLSPGDCPYVLPFSDVVGPGRWGRYSTNYWSDFLASVEPGNGTSLHDALLFALHHLDLADEIAAAANAEVDKDTDSPATNARAGQDAASATGTGNAGARNRGDARQESSGESEPAEATRAALMALLAEVITRTSIDFDPTHAGNCDLRVMPEEGAIKAILLLSDGADTTSDASFGDALLAARLANVPVFPVLLGSAGKDPELRATLTQISAATGGLLTSDVAPDRLAAAYNDVLAYLRSTYVLSYSPSFGDDADREAPVRPRQDDAAESTGMEAWHEVRVELRRPLLQTIVRPGYYR